MRIGRRLAIRLAAKARLTMFFTIIASFAQTTIDVPIAVAERGTNSAGLGRRQT
jgi:hypothetical protein